MAAEWNVPLAAAVPGRLPPFRDERGTCAQRVRKTDFLERDPFQCPFQVHKLHNFFPEPDLVNGGGEGLPGPLERSSTFLLDRFFINPDHP